MLSLAAGVSAAFHHPLSPVWATAWVLVWTVASWRWEGSCLWAVPAVLPWASLAPWTGWALIDESDLLLAGLVAGSWARLAWPGAGQPGREPAGRPPSRIARGLPWIWLGVAAIGLVRVFGVSPWPGWDVHADQAHVLNALRLTKGLVWAAALWPVLAQACRRDGPAAWRAWSHGMVAGLAVVVAAGVAERLAFTGLWDFSSVYRITATFWEMHVGGGAIDAYLVLSVPFLVEALWRARSRLAWAVLACLAVATAYVCLVTYARGVYIGVAAGLAVLAGLRLWERRVRGRARSDWHRPAGWTLAAVILAEIAVVVAGGTFMASRWMSGDRDMGGRLWHWQYSLATMAGPADVLLGIGPGRFPARVAALGPEHELSGRARSVRDESVDRAHLRLSGPGTREELGGLFMLAQRVAPQPGARLRADLEVRAPGGGAVELSLCERHLLYVGRCRYGMVEVPAAPGWQAVPLHLRRWVSDRSGTQALRPVVFGVSVLSAGRQVDLAKVALTDVHTGASLLRNGDFAAGMVRWWPMAQFYFLPWHVDNLYLEVFIERGLAGLLLLGAAAAAALSALLGRRRSGPEAGCLLAALCGVLVVGAVSSVMDVPRVALLCLMVCALAVCRVQASDTGSRR